LEAALRGGGPGAFSPAGGVLELELGLELGLGFAMLSLLWIWAIFFSFCNKSEVLLEIFLDGEGGRDSILCMRGVGRPMGGEALGIFTLI